MEEAGPRRGGPVGISGPVFERHIVDRLAMESLLGSMRDYEAEVDERLLFKPEPNVKLGLERMLGVVKRQSEEPMPADVVETLYNPIYLVAELAKAQREVAALVS